MTKSDKVLPRVTFENDSVQTPFAQRLVHESTRASGIKGRWSPPGREGELGLAASFSNSFERQTLRSVQSTMS